MNFDFLYELECKIQSQDMHFQNLKNPKIFGFEFMSFF